jgi:hypothetical protein
MNFWDVLIIHRTTREIAAVIGTRLADRAADRRMATGLTRVNDDYTVVQIPAGNRFAKGDILP